MKPRQLLVLAALLLTAACGRPNPAPSVDSGVDGSSEDGGAADAGADMTTADCPGELPMDGARSFDDPRGAFSVSVSDDDCARTYRLASTADRRDGQPDSPRIVSELDGWPTLRTGSAVFDGLYAMTMEEVRQNSVDAISDGSFNDGQPIECPEGGCFETGEKWKYVWTRDISYALDLGLAALDPLRAKNSLLYKISTRRDGSDLQVMQDTGTGGSYPVSSDRVVWALGARAVAAELSDAERDGFVAQAAEALANTVEHDRAVVFDTTTALYRGEQSFLDWREQSYPRWVEGDPTHIAMSRTLSTNLLHWHALHTAAELAEEPTRTQYRTWADELGASLERFWLEDESLLSAYFVTQLDDAPSRQYDLLGTALAIELGAMPDRADALLANYPHYGVGVPVLFPQQQFTPIYHNRGEWPFVSAYWLRAASGRNAAVADRMIETLVRGAGLNLSNMENWEADSGEPWVEDGDYSGPVVNSQRQLWSVAAFVSMIHQSIFGISTELGAAGSSIAFSPNLPRAVRQNYFPESGSIVLRGYPHAGKTIDIVLQLPPDDGEPVGFYHAASATIDAQAYVPGEPVATADLPDGAVVTIELEVPQSPVADGITVVGSDDWTNVFGPRPPALTLAESAGQVQLTWSTEDDPSMLSWNVYRDGTRVASVDGAETSWVDTDQAANGPTVCYVVESCFVGSGNCSQHSEPMCWWGPAGERIDVVAAPQLTNTGGVLSTQYGKEHWSEWGDADHALAYSGWTPTESGTHLLQLEYGNGAGGVTTGITCSVKRVDVIDESTDQSVGGGYIVMPHLGDWATWGLSTFVEVSLDAGTSYRIELTADDYAINMSSFDHFATYNGAGGDAPFARANIAALRILR